jgi:salicylate hydroxylase
MQASGSTDYNDMKRKLRIALVGGGLGGLTAALALARNGFETHVFEQASELREVGAGITLSPNATKVLRALGLEEELKTRGFESDAIVGRDWTTARPLFCVPLKGSSDSRFGAAHIDIHRADLLDILAAAVRSESRIHLASRCVSVSSSDHRASLTLQDGKREEFDLVVGCDGIHSSVRAALHGFDTPRFTGNMCWRALIPVERLPAEHIPPDVTIWTGPGGHIVTFHIRGGALVNLVAVREVTHWVEESWSTTATTHELVAAYPGVHKDLRILLERTSYCFKWGLFDRDPLMTWSAGRITLLGDAAHPMLPFLWQGAAMAMEDAYMLAIELARSPDNVAAALRAYEAERVPRTRQVQLAVRRQGKIFHLTSPMGRVSRLFRNWTAKFVLGNSAALKTDWLYAYDPTRGSAFKKSSGFRSLESMCSPLGSALSLGTDIQAPAASDPQSTNSPSLVWFSDRSRSDRRGTLCCQPGSLGNKDRSPLARLESK